MDDMQIPQYSSAYVNKLYDNVFYDPKNGNLIEVDGITYTRRRGRFNLSSTKTLDNISQECLNPNLEYRFVDADKLGRVSALKEIGWTESPAGAVTDRVVRDGNKKGTKKMVLMQTPKVFVEQRKAEKAAKKAREAEAIAQAKNVGGVNLPEQFFSDKMGRI
jgi:hypothetical protein